MTLTFDSPLDSISGVGSKYSQIFNKRGFKSVFDLLLHFPVNYLDFSQVKDTPEANKLALYKVSIKRWRGNYGRFYRRHILQATGEIKTTKISIILFNKPYMAEFLKNNREFYLWGIAQKEGDLFLFKNPAFYATTMDSLLLPIYESIANIKTGQIRKIIGNIFKSLSDSSECLPPHILLKYQFPSMEEAFRKIHLPDRHDIDGISNYKSRFIYTEFFYFQLELQYVRQGFRHTSRMHHYSVFHHFTGSIDDHLPFRLTDDQMKAYEDIINDLKAPFPMRRLLQGDVGSGKTVVAFLALMEVLANGLQAAFLAPTEILASQHFMNALQFFKKKDEIAFLSGSSTVKTRNEIKEGLASGQIKIVFGTHALLEEDIVFLKLALIIIDEQHRFGVAQRAMLYYKGQGVDVLVLTATPIPRTLMLTIYNDLSVSTIRSKPAGRKPVVTRIISGAKRDQFYRWFKQRLKDGHKGYVILPLVEESDHSPELKSIEGDREFYQEALAPIRMNFISGRTPVDKKFKILNEFREGSIQLLIATTVIEVGIDVSDATLIVIENADRYGLAQLHQLRGRVGRGEMQAWCFLIESTNSTEKGRRRLEFLQSTHDGFHLAEYDLKMRGGGIIIGLDQSGFVDFKIGDIKNDYPLFQQAREDATVLLKNPSRQNSVVKKFLKRIDEKKKRINFS